MSLDTFCKNLKAGGGRHNKIKLSGLLKIILLFFPPKLPSNKKSLDTYPEYCKLNLIRFVPWKEDIESVHGGSESTGNDWINIWEEFVELVAGRSPEEVFNKM